MDVCIDSRKIKSGQVFIPIKGKRVDGHQFIPDVIKKGATVLDVDLTKFASKYRKKLKCHVIGITGSAGKTTTKDLLHALLSQKYNVVSTRENENNEIGVPLTLLKADARTDILLVEMAIRKPGDMDVLAKMVRPTHVIITTIGITHIEHLKSQKGIAKEKSAIFRPPLAWETYRRYGFLNMSAPFYEWMKKRAEKNQYTVLPFKGENKVDQTMNLCYLIGKQFDLSDTQIAEGLRTFKGSSHRLTKIPYENATLIDDTYNSNPDGVEYAFEFISKMPGRKLAVLGDMLELGSMSQAAHQHVIDNAVNYNIECLFTLGDAFAACKQRHIPLYQYQTKKDLIYQLSAEIKENDIVLIKGSRGMAMEDIISQLSGSQPL